MSYNCGDAEGFPILIFIPSWCPRNLRSPFRKRYCLLSTSFREPRAIPRIPSGLSSSVRPIWPALGELSTGAGNRGVLGAWLICISMALLLVDGLPSRWTPSFIESDKRK